MKWFDELIGINGYDFDTICRGILITLFGLMEEAITSDNDKCFENLFRDYLIEGEIFKELVEIVLPAKLKNNRMCTIYLVEVLKAIFENCVYKSIVEMSTKSPADGVPVDIDSSLFITTMQKMVCGGSRAAKNESVQLTAKTIIHSPCSLCCVPSVMLQK